MEGGEGGGEEKGKARAHTKRACSSRSREGVGAREQAKLAGVRCSSRSAMTARINSYSRSLVHPAV
jgi:hypothetical protein